MSVYEKLRDIESLADNTNTKLDTINTSLQTLETATNDTVEQVIEHWWIRKNGTNYTDTTTGTGARWYWIQNTEGKDVTVKAIYFVYTTSDTTDWHAIGFLDAVNTGEETFTLGKGTTTSAFTEETGQYTTNVRLFPFLTHTQAFDTYTGFFFKIPVEQVIADDEYILANIQFDTTGTGMHSITLFAEVLQ